MEGIELQWREPWYEVEKQAEKRYILYHPRVHQTPGNVNRFICDKMKILENMSAGRLLHETLTKNQISGVGAMSPLRSFQPFGIFSFCDLNFAFSPPLC